MLTKLISNVNCNYKDVIQYWLVAKQTIYCVALFKLAVKFRSLLSWETFKKSQVLKFGMLNIL